MRGAHLAVDGVRVVLEVASESEIRHLHDAVGGEQDVRGFEVAVHHAVAVEVRHGVGDGAEERPHLGLVEKATLLASAADQTLEVAPGGPLEHDDEGLIVEERVEHLDDVRVSEVAQELHLAEAPIALAPRHVAHVHALDRHRATVRESLALVHHAVTALTDLLTHAVPTVELGHGLGGDGGRPPRESPDSADLGRDDGVSDEQSQGGRLGDSIPGCVPSPLSRRASPSPSYHRQHPARASRLGAPVARASLPKAECRNPENKGAAARGER